MTKTADKNELVEVNLHFELPAYIPTVGKDGELTFYKKNIAPENGIQVKLPLYAIRNEDSLTNYLQTTYEDNGYDMTTVENPNIWVSDTTHKEKGFFKWDLSFGRYD